jgi:hypothetical protein
MPRAVRVSDNRRVGVDGRTAIGGVVITSDRALVGGGHLFVGGLIGHV